MGWMKTLPAGPTAQGFQPQAGLHSLVFTSLAFIRLIFGHVLQKCRRRHEEQVSGDGAAEVEYPVVVAGRPADEHVLEHLLDGARRTAVADEVGAKFTMPGPAEGHVVTQDLDLFPVLDDRGERVVRGRWLDGIVQFDIGKLGAPDDAFLRFRGERIPCVQDREDISAR